MEAVIRAERDLLAIGKLAPRTVSCVHLGVDTRRGGYFGYCVEWRRLTTFRSSEFTFFEEEFPRVDFIVGHHLSEKGITQLKSQQQQEAEASSYQRVSSAPVMHTPELEPEIASYPPSMEQAGDNQSPEFTLPPLYSWVRNQDEPPSHRTRSQLAYALEVGQLPVMMNVT